ncbi:MAG: hypothetical protein C4337_08125 [Armatimonadota bacterium]
MAVHQTEEREGKLRTVLKLEPGERVAICRCLHSKTFPFCDGTHKTLPNSNAGPAIVEARTQSTDNGESVNATRP